MVSLKTVSSCFTLDERKEAAPLERTHPLELFGLNLVIVELEP